MRESRCYSCKGKNPEREILHTDKRSALPAQDVCLQLMLKGFWRSMSKKLLSR